MTTKKRICTVIIVLVIVCAVCVGGFLVWKKTGKGGSKSSQKVYVQKVSSLNTASDFKLSNRSFLGVVEAQESVDVKYDSSKTVDEILSLMTEEEAAELVVTTGVNKGWTMAQVSEQRPSSLKYYAYLCEDCGNIVKAAAMLLMGGSQQLKAS